MSEWIFFDCFNTLIDDFDASGDESGLGTLPELAVELGAARDREEFLAAYRRACPIDSGDYAEVLLTRRLAEAVASLGRLPPDSAGKVVQRLLDRWHDEYEPALRLTPGATEMLAHWHGARRMAVVSNFYLPGYPGRYLERFGIVQYFDFVLDSASCGHRKPGALIFAIALRRAGCAPTDVLFIGDRPDLDVEPAHRQGMAVLHFDRSSMRPGSAKTPAGFRAVRTGMSSGSIGASCQLLVLLPKTFPWFGGHASRGHGPRIGLRRHGATEAIHRPSRHSSQRSQEAGIIRDLCGGRTG